MDQLRPWLGDSAQVDGPSGCPRPRPASGPHLPEIEIQTQIIPASRPATTPGQSPGAGVRRGSWLSPLPALPPQPAAHPVAKCFIPHGA